jgi:hypothetical protein
MISAVYENQAAGVNADAAAKHQLHRTFQIE